MKPKTAFSAALLAGLSLIPMSHISGQGDLNPPGPPGPTMKSLDQVEARTIVNATNTPGDVTTTYVIDSPGSYYLVGNLMGEGGKGGISIRANDVTLDLNGFAVISGGGPGARGIDLLQGGAGGANVCIRNGTVRGWTDGGVNTIAGTNAMVERLRLVDNLGGVGLTMWSGSVKDCVASGNGTGFAVGNGAQVTGCTATGNATGFYITDRCHVSNCIATINTGTGFNCTSFITLIDCTSSRNAGSGIVTGESCDIVRCNGSRNDLVGILVDAGCTLADCTAGSNLLEGFKCGANNTLRSCTAIANHFRGIFCSVGATVSVCTASNNFGTGFEVGSGSTIQDSTAYANLTHTYPTGGGGGTTEDLSFGIKAGNGSAIMRCTTANHTYAGIAAQAGGCTIADCTINGNNYYGVLVGLGTTVRGCTIRGTLNGDGINAQGACHIVGNTCDANGQTTGGYGIKVNGDGTRIEGNNCTFNWAAFYVSGHSFMTHNTVRLHANGNSIGPEVSRGNFLGYVNGGTIPVSEAWANFTY